MVLSTLFFCCNYNVIALELFILMLHLISFCIFRNFSQINYRKILNFLYLHAADVLFTGNDANFVFFFFNLIICGQSLKIQFVVN